MANIASTQRGRRLLALALAASSIGVIGLTTAASAQAATSGSDYQGTSDASALQLVVTLPSAIAGPLGSALPNPIDLSLIRSTGQSSHDGVNPDVANSTSQLAQGSIISSGALGSVLSPLLDRSVQSSLANPDPASVSVASLPSNPLGLNLAVGPLAASSNKTSKASTGSGVVGSGALGSLSTLAPQLTGPLESTISQITGGVATATQALSSLSSSTTAVTDPINSALGTLNGVIASVPVPNTGIAGVPTSIPVTLPNVSLSTLTDTINQIPAIVTEISNDLLSGAVLGLGAVSSTEGVSPSGAGTTTTGGTNTGDISLFGGLLSVTASKASATASATGTPGKSTANATATLVKVSLGDQLTQLLDLEATEQGIIAAILPTTSLGSTLSSTVQPVIDDINNGLNAALASLVSLLQSLDSDTKVLNQGTTSTTVSPDGRHAEAHATPAQVILGLPGATNLVALSLGKVDVVANQENVTTNPVVVPPTTGKASSSKPVAPTKKLAYTGADLPLTAGAALLLLAAGAGLARRRRHGASE